MSRQRSAITMTLGLALVAAPAVAQQITKPRPVAPNQKPAANPARNGGNAQPVTPLPAMTPEMERLLSAWEKKNGELTTLEAKFERKDDFVTVGLTSVYEGTAILQAPNLAYLDFRERHPDGTIDGITERIVCMGDTVLQYVADTKQVLVWPLAKDERNKAMEEGPLPFLFNMKAAEVKKRYAFRLLPGLAARPNHYRIEIIPKLPIDQDAFLTAQIFLDKEKFLPSDIKLFLPNGQDTQVYMFKDRIIANPKVDPKVFSFVMYKGWVKVVNPGSGPGAGQAPKQVGARPGPKLTRPR